MKIGIVTQPLYDNYGGILQNWAMQRVLSGLGHAPITIDYLPKQSLIRHLLSRINTLMKRLKGGKVKYPIREHIRNQQFDNFVKHHLTTTRICHAYHHSIIEEYGIEMICIGSDQVWRPEYNGGVLYDMYGRFSSPTPAFTYAASFGVGKWEYTSIQTKNCRELVKSLRGVSVREKAAIDLCRLNLDIEAKYVLDPTLLVSKEEYEALVENIPATEEKYILAYILDENDDKNKWINSVAENKNLPIHRVSIYNKKSKSVENWLQEFRDASFVVTDSYHGLVFSIIFHKNFKLLTNPHRGQLRFMSLLDTCGLGYKIDEHKIFSDINWKDVDMNINKYRDLSTEYLRLMLN